MRKLLTGFVLMLTLLVAWSWLARRVEPLLSPQDATRATAALFAQGQTGAAQKDAMTVGLYFRYMQTEYLAQEARVLEVARNETVEMAIVRAMMDGPSGLSPELSPLFSTSDRLVNVHREEDGVISVVLGAQFLDKPPDAPAEWEKFDYWVAEVPRRRRLAIQAITDALTEGGRCTAVQFLVSSSPEDTQGTRMPNALFYGGDPNALLPPQTRHEDAVLTPHVALNAALDAWQRKDWMQLYAFLLSESQDGTLLPSQTDFLSQISKAEQSLLYYQASLGTISVDGATATLCVDAKVMRGDGETWEVQQIPVQMVRERGGWKLPYDTFMRFYRK